MYAWSRINVNTEFLNPRVTDALHETISEDWLPRFDKSVGLVYSSPPMVIGERLRELRIEKKLSQGDMEKRTGLLRCYTSRVENGHTVPNLGTLEKYAQALEVPLYRLFYEGNKPAKLPRLFAGNENEWGKKGKDAAELRTLARLLGRMKSEDQKLLLGLAARMAGRKKFSLGAPNGDHT